MSKLEQAKLLLGETLMTGFPGKSLSAETKEYLTKERIGAVLLFTHNFDSATQVTKLCNEIQECRTELPLWIAVDHEGGRVQRFKNDFTIMPTALSVAQKDSAKYAFEIAAGMAAELHSVGININFSPVADINTNPKNPVIGDRAFGDTEEVVSKFVSSYVRGHLQSKVQPCVKHFPGHGDTHLDSHFALPKVDTDSATLREREFKPFLKGFKSGCNMVMTAHVLMPSLDEKNTATMSKHILIDILRGELRFEGIIISDDLEMKAIADHFGEEEAPILALEAGCDLLIYRSLPATKRALESMKKALADGRLTPERVIDAAERCMKLKRDTLLPFEPAQGPFKKCAAL